MIWLIAAAAGLIALGAAAVHIGFRAPRVRERGTPADAGMRFRAVSLPARGGKRLAGWFLEPPDGAGARGPAVIIIHGWGANMEMMLPLARVFYGAGMNVLLFDARNHGASPADGHSSMPKFAQDALAALDWLRAQGHTGGIALAGHSVGAAAAILAAAWRGEEIAAVVAIASFAHPARLMNRAMARLRLPGLLRRAALRYVERVIGYKYEDIAPENAICRVSCPVLLAHGTADAVIPVSDMERIARCRNGRVETLRAPGAGHDSVEKIAACAETLTEFVARACAAGAAGPAGGSGLRRPDWPRSGRSPE